jgi:predicted site-specific integrase-resolvase
MNNRPLVKIAFAARALEVTPKTIYNWIEQGLLEMPEKGYVDKNEVYKVYEEQIAKRSELSKRLAINGIGRDRQGRFIPLGEIKHNIARLPKDPN